MNTSHRLDDFIEYYDSLMETSGLRKIAEFSQHGKTSRLLHSAAVAYYSYRLARFTRLRFHLHDLVRGALLHDYFLYDAQDGAPERKGHWTRHPAIALLNADKEVNLSPIERDIIIKHMFPLTLVPPRCREGVVVSCVDKACSVYEFFSRKRPYPHIQEKVLHGRLSASEGAASSI